MAGLDFEGLNRALLPRIEALIPQWLPGGRRSGHEWVCGDATGKPGRSFSVNLETGKWADFATADKGGDLISLYAAVMHRQQGEAAKELAEMIGFDLGDERRAPPSTPSPTEGKTILQENEVIIPVKPPADVGPPAMHGSSASWCYRDENGDPMFYVARYETPENPKRKKKYMPWIWDGKGKRWVSKMWHRPRPLYGLELLHERPEDPVMIVEGEKACDAARKMCGHVYVCVTWCGGSSAPNLTDWKPVYGRRNVLIVPDADAAGIKAARAVWHELNSSVEIVKMVDTSGQPEGWDVADAVADGWDYRQFKEWAAPRARLISPTMTLKVKADKAAIALKAGAAAVQINVANDGKAPIVTDDQFGEWVRLGITLTKSGAPVCNMATVCTVLENKVVGDKRVQIWYDEFHNRIFTDNGGSFHEWGEKDDHEVLWTCQNKLCLAKISLDHVHQAVKHMAYCDRRNEVRDWMSSLTWDGQKRVDTFFSQYVGCKEPDAYLRAVGRNFWVSLAARVFRPGCQVDTMVVLQGPEGVFKTTCFRIIGGKWYAESSSSVADKDFLCGLTGKLLIEIAELGSFSKVDSTIIKQVLSRNVDRYREPYGRSASDHPRMSVFCGTTNNDNPIRHETGSRRFLPVRVGKIITEAIERDRDQLFAEAVQLLHDGENWHHVPREVTSLVHESFREWDEWENHVERWIDTADLDASPVTTFRVAKEALQIEVSRLDVPAQRRIAQAMKACGWKNVVKRVPPTMKPARVWLPPEQLRLDAYNEDKSAEAEPSAAATDSHSGNGEQETLEEPPF